MRFKIDGAQVHEVFSSSGSYNWNTNGAAATDHVIIVEAAGNGDNNWSNLGTRSLTFTLDQPGGNNSNSGGGGGSNAGGSGSSGGSSGGITSSGNSSGSGSNSVATIKFWVDRSSLQRGECTSVKWDVRGVNAVFLSYGGNREPRAGHIYNEQRVCPSSTTTYTLEIDTGRGWETRRETINVSGSNTSNSGSGSGTNNSTSGASTSSTLGTATYTVQSGDTLWGISQKFGTDINTLLRLNPWITNANAIMPGWQISVPTASSNIPSLSSFDLPPTAGSSAQLTWQAQQRNQQIWECVKRDIELLPSAIKQTPTWYQNLESFLDAIGFTFKLIRPPIHPLEAKARVIATGLSLSLKAGWYGAIIYNCWFD
jgi:LysM repeat protein